MDDRRQTMLIIGGTGSLGHVLVNRFLPDFDIYIYSRDECKQWMMRNRYDSEHLHFIIGDISDIDRLRIGLLRSQPDYIIIAAALKHIDICEYNTSQSIKTNVTGIQNIVDCITRLELPRLKSTLFVSTDKACDPANVYGMCKALSERVVIEQSIYSNKTFVIVRYGNVINSRGSLLPKFHSMGRDNSKTEFTVTCDEMTRFFMSLEQSVDLISHALFQGHSGRIYIPDIDSYKIVDIANEFSKIYDKPVIFTGIRPGEKMHETLINAMELRRTVREGEFYVIHSPYENFTGQGVDMKEYNSFVALTDDLQKLREIIEITGRDGV